MLLIVLKASGCVREGVGAWPDASEWSYMLLGGSPPNSFPGEVNG